MNPFTALFSVDHTAVAFHSLPMRSIGEDPIGRVRRAISVAQGILVSAAITILIGGKKSTLIGQVYRLCRAMVFKVVKGGLPWWSSV